MCEIKKSVINVLSEVLNVPSEKIKEVDNFIEIDNWDSLHHLNVVLGIEAKFGIRFDIEEIILVTSISSAVDLVSLKKENLN